MIPLPMQKYKKEELSEALRAIESLVSKLVKVQKRLRKGTPQATLAKRRIKALRISAALIKKDLKQ